jgi:hypothetical protein
MPGNIQKVVFKFGKQPSSQHGVFHQFLEQKSIPADDKKVPHETMKKAGGSACALKRFQDMNGT